jgi:hypothetical protein
MTVEETKDALIASGEWKNVRHCAGWPKYPCMRSLNGNDYSISAIFNKVEWYGVTTNDLSQPSPHFSDYGKGV